MAEQNFVEEFDAAEDVVARDTGRAYGGEMLLRLPEVLRRTGRSRAGIYDLMSRGEFPLPVRVGAKAVAWKLSSVQAWIESRPVVRRLESPQVQM